MTRNLAHIHRFAVGVAILTLGLLIASLAGAAPPPPTVTPSPLPSPTVTATASATPPVDPSPSAPAARCRNYLGCDLRPGGPIALDPVQNLAVTTTATTAHFTFDTRDAQQLTLRADGEHTDDVFAHIADEAAPLTHHDLSLINLRPWSTYHYRLAFTDGSGSESDTFQTGAVSVSNVRTQIEGTTAHIWFDTSTPADATVTIAAFYTAERHEIGIHDAAQAWALQPGLKPGTPYKFTISIAGHDVWVGTFATETTVDPGTALNPSDA